MVDTTVDDEAPRGGIGLRANIRLDLDTARRAFPLGQLIIPIGAFAIGAGHRAGSRPGYYSIYSESLTVIIVLAAVGAFGRTIGTLAVVGHAATEMAHFLLIPDPTTGAQVDRDTIVGRLVAEGVLWLVVVLVPSVGRRSEWIAEQRLGRALAGRLVGAGVGAVIVGSGAYLWANVMPYLLRAAYTYSPPPFTLRPQQQPEFLAEAIGLAFLRDRRPAPAHGRAVGGLGAPAGPAQDRDRRCPGPIGHVRHPHRHGVRHPGRAARRGHPRGGIPRG